MPLTEQRISWAVKLEQYLSTDERQLLCDGAAWLVAHDGKLEDWELETNLELERMAYCYLRVQFQRGDTFEYMTKMFETVRRFGTLSIPQLRGVLNCMRAATLRKAQPAADAVIDTIDPPVALPRGIFTVVRDGGEHRTYKITLPTWGNFTDGRVAISLLTGQNNESDYQGVAFLLSNGTVAPWKRFSGNADALKADIRVLLDPASAHEAGRQYAVESGNCYKCGRTLSTPESIAAGIGPICESRL